MCTYSFLKKLGILTSISINSIPMSQKNAKSFLLKRVKIKKRYGFWRKFNLNCFHINPVGYIYVYFLRQNIALSNSNRNFNVIFEWNELEIIYFI